MPNTTEQTTNGSEASYDAAAIFAAGLPDNEVSRPISGEKVLPDPDLIDDEDEELDDTAQETTDADDKVTPPSKEGQADEEKAKSDDQSETADDIPKLDEGIREALKDKPELIARWDNHWKGVEKTQAKLKENVAAQNNYIALENALANKESAPATLKRLADQVAAHHGTTVAELLGLSKEEVKSVPTDDKPHEFEFESDRLVYDRAVADAEKRVLERLGIKDPAQLQNLFKSQSEAEQAKTIEAKRTAWLDENAPLIISKIDKTLDGWAVTREMVAKSRELFPQEDSVVALKRAFPDEFAAHKVAKAAPKTTAPDMVKATTAQGFTGNVNAGEANAADIWKNRPAGL